MYFDGYFNDPFTPPADGHAYPTRTGGPLGDAQVRTSLLSLAAAPRAAFPTYSFQAASSGALALALPIKGVPVALGFLNAERASGSVTIADARTYGADPQALYQRLRAWAEDDPVQQGVLAETVARSTSPVYLRVVTRVYLAGAMIVSIENAAVSGFRGQAGQAPTLPENIAASRNAGRALRGALTALDGAGDAAGDDTGDDEVDSPHEEAVENEASEGEAEPGAEREADEGGAAAEEEGGAGAEAESGGSDASPLPDIGAAVRVAWASSRSVTMSEKFDTLLVVGYLGFDVPVLPGGVLGVPIPTFQRLEGNVVAPAMRRMMDLTQAERDAVVASFALSELVRTQPDEAMRVVYQTARDLGGPHLSPFAPLALAWLTSQPTQQPQSGDQAASIVAAFDEGTWRFIGEESGRGPAADAFGRVFARAFDLRDKPLQQEGP